MLQLPQLLGLRIGFVSQRARNRFWWIPFRSVRQFVFVRATHLGMAINAARDRQAELFLIFEHEAGHSLLLYLVLLFKRRPVFFFVHGMQQAATRSVHDRIALDVCRWWVGRGKFHPLFVSLDDGALPSNRRFEADKALVIPHPHPLADGPQPYHLPRAPHERFRVGMIGWPRQDKPIRRLADVLRRARMKLDFDLVIGTPLATKPAWMDGIGAEIMDTTTDAQYGACLSSLDIIVMDFTKEHYYFRPSGAIVDAAMNRCFVLCPDFPVLRAQISQPVPVGATFRVLEEALIVLARVMQELERAPVDTETWRLHHGVGTIAATMRVFLNQRAPAAAKAAPPGRPASRGGRAEEDR
jgi:hypothetical protein